MPERMPGAGPWIALKSSSLGVSCWSLYFALLRRPLCAINSQQESASKRLIGSGTQTTQSLWSLKPGRQQLAYPVDTQFQFPHDSGSLRIASASLRGSKEAPALRWRHHVPGLRGHASKRSTLREVGPVCFSSRYCRFRRDPGKHRAALTCIASRARQRGSKTSAHSRRHENPSAGGYTYERH